MNREQIANEIAGATVFQSGEYFRDGKYMLLVNSLKLKEGNEGTSFIAEFFVEECAPKEPGITPNSVGSRVSTVMNITKQKQMALGNIKALALELVGLTEAELDAQQDAENAKAATENRAPKNILATWIVRATNESPSAGTVQPARGIRVACETNRRASRADKAAGKPREQWGVWPKFRHVPGNTPETIKANRAKVDASAPVQATQTPPPAAPVAEAAPATAPTPSGVSLDSLFT